jgi:hypothetical protein
VPDSDVTIGEVYRRLTSVEQNFQAGFNRLGDRIDRLEFVRTDVHQADIASVRAEIAVERARNDEQDDDKKWTRRALFTSLLLPVIVGLLLAALVLQGSA